MDEDQVNTILREIKKGNDAVTSLKTAVTERFDTVDVRLNHVDVRLNHIEGAMATKKDISDLSEQIDELAGMTARHFERLEKSSDAYLTTPRLKYDDRLRIIEQKLGIPSLQ